MTDKIKPMAILRIISVLNDNPLTAQEKTKQYSEGYKIGYDDELNLLIHG